ncbi:MAG: hypothetical protein ACREMA_17600, partial [Longimicrobiales bacterium]
YQLAEGQALSGFELANADMTGNIGCGSQAVWHCASQKLKWTRDGRYVIATGSSNVTLWDVSSGYFVLKAFALGNDFVDADVDGLNNYLFTITPTTIQRWPVFTKLKGPTGAAPGEFPHGTPLNADPFSVTDPPSACVFASACLPGTGTPPGGIPGDGSGTPEQQEFLDGVGHFFGTSGKVAAGILAAILIGMCGLVGYSAIHHPFGGKVGAFAGFVAAMALNWVPVWIPVLAGIGAIAYIVHHGRGG